MTELPQRLIVQRHDGPLGTWRMALLLPDERLAASVEFLWCVEGGNPHEVARILPRGNAHLMFNLGAPQRLLEPTGAVVFRHAWFSGQQQRFLDVEGTGENAIVGVRFRAPGAWRILGIAQHELAGRVIDLDALLGDAIHALRQRLLDCDDPGGRLALLENWLLARMRDRGNSHYAVRWALRRLEETHGGIDVAGLARELGFSRRHLAQLFQREAGLSPKALARVLRFSHTLDCVRGAATPRWDRVALDCGYYDQSHMIRDFQAFSGHAPRDFLRRPAFDDETISEAPPSVQ